MYPGDLWIAGEEIERIAWKAGELTLNVRWTLEEVPVLLDLPHELMLRWHEDDPAAGIPAELRRWRFRANRGLRLVVALSPPAGGERTTTRG